MGLRCVGFDRLLDTDRPIPGALSVPVGAEEPGGVRIRWRPAVPPLDDLPIWTREGQSLRFVAPGVARYRCAAHAIEVTPFDGADPDLVDALLIATALPTSQWLAGAFVLHAAALVPRADARAIAIAGASGRGKSRTAAALLDKGAALVADDSIAVRWDDALPRCAGLAGGYHLAASGDGERRFHPLPPDRTRRSALLGAVIVLMDEGATGRLDGVAAVEALLANRHRPNAPRHAGLEPRRLADAARLARSVPIYRWRCGDNSALPDDDDCRAIMRDWRLR